MNCIIIDDEATAQMLLEKLCTQIEKLQVQARFSNPIEAIKFLNQHDVDLIFLDIHMPGFSGIDLIKTLHNSPKIILTTSDPNFAIEAFEYKHVVDYLVKPIRFPRFEKAIKNSVLAGELHPKTENLAPPSAKDLYVNINRKLIKIHLPAIYLIAAKGDYIQIKTEKKNFIVHSTMKKIAQKLPPHLFIKVHRSFIINIKYIIDIKDNSVLIQKEIIPVSRQNRLQLMQSLNRL